MTRKKYLLYSPKTGDVLGTIELPHGESPPIGGDGPHYHLFSLIKNITSETSIFGLRFDPTTQMLYKPKSKMKPGFSFLNWRKK